MIRRFRPHRLIIVVMVLVCLIVTGIIGACSTPATPTPTPAPTPTTPSPTPKPTTTAPTPTTPTPPLAGPLTTTSLPSGRVGSSYSGTLAAGGGTAPYTWALLSGNLPAGLALSAAGIITGTPTAAGTFNFTAQVKDGGSPPMTTQGTLTLIIAPAALTVTTASLPAGRFATPYGGLLAATGGTKPYTWSLISGNLPADVTMSPDGTILGTPGSSGAFNFTFKVTDSSLPALTAQGTLSINIAAPPIVIITTNPPLGRVDSVYSTPLLTGSGTAPFTWTVIGGNLPAGLTLSTAGVISGTPTTIGTSTFTVQVTDSSTPSLVAQMALSVTIAAPVVNPLTIVTPYLPIGRAGTNYTVTLVANGGAAPYVWSIVSGSVPAGLSLTANGVLSGVPAFSGTFNFVIRVTDSSSPANSAERTFVLVV